MVFVATINYSNYYKIVSIIVVIQNNNNVGNDKSNNMFRKKLAGKVNKITTI